MKSFIPTNKFKFAIKKDDSVDVGISLIAVDNLTGEKLKVGLMQLWKRSNVAFDKEEEWRRIDIIIEEGN